MGKPVVPNRYRNIVQRIAVLNAIQRPYKNAAEICDGTARLSEQWHRRSEELLAAGWQPSRSRSPEKAKYVARYCNPPFVLADSPSRACYYCSACPFCYARRVGDMWDLLEAVCRRDAADAEQLPEEDLLEGLEDDTRVLTHMRHKLVFRRHAFVCEFSADSDHYEDTVALLGRITVNRKFLCDLVKPVGAVMAVTIEPADNGLRAVYRQVFLLTKSAEFPPGVAESTLGYVNEFADVTRRSIYKEFGRLMRYPDKLLTAEAGRTAALLNACSATRFKSIERYRGFRRRGFDVMFDD